MSKTNTNKKAKTKSIKPKLMKTVKYKPTIQNTNKYKPAGPLILIFGT